MLAERLPVFVGELRLDALQRPGELRAVRLAAVNLFSLRVHLRKKLFIGGRPHCFRRRLRTRYESRSKEHRKPCKSREASTHGGISLKQPP